MNKKICILAMCLAVVAVFACAAADAASATVILNGVPHAIWVAKGYDIVIGHGSGRRRSFLHLSGDLHAYGGAQEPLARPYSQRWFCAIRRNRAGLPKKGAFAAVR